MIKTSDIKVGSFIRFDGSCEEYNRTEYGRYLNCDLKVIAVKFYHQGIVHLKLTSPNGEEISLPLDINTASRLFILINNKGKTS